ncbi:hypothetical protein [Streptomyces sp. NPDC048710]|uniref:hypothetical protein n=1 Tax=Streptomyces sp. NPDC048710 TaxID=3365586 RepID=UPI003722C3C3
MASDAPVSVTRLRLLPWSTESGKPCFLSSDSGSVLARLADQMEAIQLGMGGDVLKEARKVLENPLSTHAEIRYAGVRLAESLRDVLRVAESRGMRLPLPDDDDSESDAESPAEASA